MSDDRSGASARRATGRRAALFVGGVLVSLAVGGLLLVLLLGGDDAPTGRPDPGPTPAAPGGTPTGETDATDPEEPTGDATATADLVEHPDTPAGVVDAFLTAVTADDCPTASAMISRSFVAAHGGCAEGVPGDFTWMIGAGTVDDGAGVASVETMLFRDAEEGEEPEGQPARFQLVRVHGDWLVDDIL